RREPFAPELALDRLFPVVPGWALVYGALYLFLIFLPVLTVRDEEHIRRTVFAYLSVWITSYLVFVAFPTIAPRPPEVVGAGFGAWALRGLYDADPPYNCFPSLHVAHSFVSALTCRRLHRGVGASALAAASLVALSTLFTKQHYLVDVAAGLGLALLASLGFLRTYPRERVPALDRRTAPLLALSLFALTLTAVGGLWVFYRWRVG
ncbi:MAG: phosphatase PAP2 family protein, partial [Acidobacteria bacterium]|nr:phosphatase PAP2 family protein [Acidobacteriota bacterium]